MADNEVNLYLFITSELFAMTLCNFSDYLVKLTLCSDIVNITFFDIK